MRILKDQNPYIQLHHRAKQFQNIWAIKLQGPVIYMAKKAKNQLRGSLCKRLGLSQLAKKGKWTWRVCKESTSLPSTFVCFSIDLPKKVPKLRCHIGFSISISLVHQYLSHLTKVVILLTCAYYHKTFLWQIKPTKKKRYFGCWGWKVKLFLRLMSVGSGGGGRGTL